MQTTFFSLTIYISIVLSVFSCAKRGSITGGPKDETPPVFLRATPPLYSTNFKSKEIRIYFDELITLENPQRQIIISPPMKEKPIISPIGTASKTIKIEFEEALLPNTTYSINFGASVVDYNEKNPFDFFQYVFSTGPVLDSLTFKGSVKDAFAQKLDPYVSLFLHEVNDTYSDSAVYKTPPRYISNTLDSTVFEFKNLKAGTYQLLAIKDNNNNYTYEPKLDKIGFSSEYITIPEDSLAALILFKEQLDFKYKRAKQVSKNQFTVGYEGVVEQPEIDVIGNIPADLETRFFKDPEKDTLNLWVKPFFEQDSIVFIAKNNTRADTLVARYKDQFKDSLNLKLVSGNSLRLLEDLIISANTPIDSLNTNFVNFVDRDTLVVPFGQKWDAMKNTISLKFNKKEESSYALQLFPGAITDFLGNTNDTIVFNLNTKKEADYGKLFLSFREVSVWPIIVQVMKSKDQVTQEKTLQKPITKATFSGLDPGDYTIRVLVDANANGKWDTGNFLKKVQPEQVVYYSKPVTVRSNWDVKQEVNLLNP